MGCRNWESGIVVRVNDLRSRSGSNSDNRSSAANMPDVKASASASARRANSSDSKAGKTSGEPEEKEVDTSHRSQDLVIKDMGIFDGMVPVPMRLPGRRYRMGEKPWFFSTQG